MGNPIIRLQDIEKRYGFNGAEVHALQAVNLTVQEGEFVAIVGPSGSGKSTLLNVIGCLDLPDSGSYLLDGREVTTLRDAELAKLRNATVGFVFQNFNLLPRSSALENVETPLIYSGLKKQQRQHQARSLLETLGLGERLHHTPSQLSGGQQQRVAIARALINEPSIVLADEPTGNLDSRSGVEVMELLQSLNEDKGMTLLVITHEPEVAARAKRRLVLRDGRLVS